MEILSAVARGRVQVWIAYGLIGIALVMGGLGVSSFIMYQKQKLLSETLASRVNSANTRLAVVEEANRTQGEAITAIRAANKLSDTLMESLQLNIAGLEKKNKQVFDQLATVRETNEAARIYLATVVPTPVGCVLDKTCAPDRNASVEAKQGLDAAVQSARAKAEQNK